MSAYKDGTEALQYVRSQMKCVSMNRNCDKDDKDAGKRLLDKVRKGEEKLASAHGEGPFIETGAKARATLKLRLGNCDELAALAFAYLAENGQRTRPLEIFEVSGGDHAFVVIGRSADTTASQPASWNASAVICDPWAEHVCYADAAGHWLDTVAGFCLDKPADWPDQVVTHSTIVIDGKSYPSTTSQGFKWNSVKQLRSQSKQLADIRVNVVASLSAGTWPYRLTGQQ